MLVLIILVLYKFDIECFGESTLIKMNKYTRLNIGVNISKFTWNVFESINFFTVSWHW